MAQIVTITNPLTGQPAQVDQLDHTAQQIDDSIGRALPGGEIDTLLAGKAPAGYGLGPTQKVINNTDIDTLFDSGFYTIGSGCTNVPAGTDQRWSGLFVMGGRACTQIYRPADNESSYFGSYKSLLIRIYKDGIEWSPWEWVNPPMKLDVEYRTTERYQGKPVYVKTIDCGLIVNGKKQVTHGIANCDYVIRYMGCADKDAMPILLNKSWDDTWIAYFGKVTNTTIEIYGGSSSAGKQVYCTMWYTKTTD